MGDFPRRYQALTFSYDLLRGLGRIGKCYRIDRSEGYRIIEQLRDAFRTKTPFYCTHLKGRYKPPQGLHEVTSALHGGECCGVPYHVRSEALHKLSRGVVEVGVLGVEFQHIPPELDAALNPGLRANLGPSHPST